MNLIIYIMAVPFSVIAKKLKIEGPRLRRELRHLDIKGLNPKADFFKKEIALAIIRALLPQKPPKSLIKKTIKEKPTKDVLYLPETITVKELAGKLSVPVTDLLKKLLKEGISANLNQTLDFETAGLIASDFGQHPELKPEQIDEEPKELKGKPRPPIVVVLGHVDHGKTTLLDYLRRTKIAESESGGITQHIGAYQVEVKADNKKRKITFIDTPGHEAFAKLRSLGAKITDLAILVVAADDGVKPQTIEAINHAKSAGVPIIVAINKVDVKAADPERVKKELSEAGLLPEEWGGTTPVAEISAKTGKNIDELLDLVLLTADLSDILAEPETKGEGVVIESHLQTGLGPVATIICSNGKFEKGNFVVAGNAWGRIKRLENELGLVKPKLLPSEPAKIVGFKKLPLPGAKVEVVASEKEAKSKAEEWDRYSRVKGFARSLFSTLAGQKILNLIIKADTQGSIDSLIPSVEKLGDKKIKIKIVHTGVGDISESDINLALAAKALILGFRVKPDLAAKKLAEQHKIKILLFEVIYDLLKKAEKLIKNLGREEKKEEKIGKALVLKIFKEGKVKIIGAKLSLGKVAKGVQCKIRRMNKQIGLAEVKTLKVFSQEKERIEKQGTEFGIGLITPTTLQQGDELIFYKKP